VSRGKVALVRLLVAHGIAYPVAIAWAFGSIPLMAVRVATSAGLPLDDKEIARRMLLLVAWPSIGSFVLEHGAGAVWALSANAARARRLFLAVTAVLLGVPILGGGISWIWLVTR
jgi:hypothetical protein